MGNQDLLVPLNAKQRLALAQFQHLTEQAGFDPTN